jgi:hypothetical protein
VLPIDERCVDKWNHDPWALDHGGDSRTATPRAETGFTEIFRTFFAKPD